MAKALIYNTKKELMDTALEYERCVSTFHSAKWKKLGETICTRCTTEFIDYLVDNYEKLSFWQKWKLEKNNINLSESQAERLIEFFPDNNHLFDRCSVGFCIEQASVHGAQKTMRGRSIRFVEETLTEEDYTNGVFFSSFQWDDEESAERVLGKICKDNQPILSMPSFEHPERFSKGFMAWFFERFPDTPKSIAQYMLELDILPVEQAGSVPDSLKGVYLRMQKRDEDILTVIRAFGWNESLWWKYASQAGRIAESRKEKPLEFSDETLFSGDGVDNVEFLAWAINNRKEQDARFISFIQRCGGNAIFGKLLPLIVDTLSVRKLQEVLYYFYPALTKEIWLTIPEEKRRGHLSGMVASDVRKYRSQLLAIITEEERKVYAGIFSNITVCDNVELSEIVYSVQFLLEHNQVENLDLCFDCAQYHVQEMRKPIVGMTQKLNGECLECGKKYL